VARVLIAGGSGMIGRALAAELAAAGSEVVVLSRAARPEGPSPPGVRFARWDGLTAGAWSDEVEGAEAIVNLSGENLAAKRWSAARKRILVASRIAPTRALVAAVVGARRPPAVFLQASGVNLYAADGDEPKDENAPSGTGFLAGLVADWEAASEPVERAGVRRVLVRSGVVLARTGGALVRMLPPFRLGLGGPLGSGNQPFPWVHLADELAAIRFLLARDDLAGPFNLVAPEPATNAELSRALARALGRPCLLRVPAWLLRLLFGEMAGVVLSGVPAVPRRLLEAGFRFGFPTLPRALADLVGRA
jgi:uncharacterized protein (TIGR01777 family)